jgi:hypothetical protein
VGTVPLAGLLGRRTTHRITALFLSPFAPTAGRQIFHLSLPSGTQLPPAVPLVGWHISLSRPPYRSPYCSQDFCHSPGASLVSLTGRHLARRTARCITCFFHSSSSYPPYRSLHSPSSELYCHCHCRVAPFWVTEPNMFRVTLRNRQPESVTPLVA